MTNDWKLVLLEGLGRDGRAVGPTEGCEHRG